MKLNDIGINDCGIDQYIVNTFLSMTAERTHIILNLYFLRSDQINTKLRNTFMYDIERIGRTEKVAESPENGTNLFRSEFLWCISEY